MIWVPGTINTTAALKDINLLLKKLEYSVDGLDRKKVLKEIKAILEGNTAPTLL